MICYTAYICMVWPPACEFVCEVEDQLLSQISVIKNRGNINLLMLLAYERLNNLFLSNIL